MRQIINGKKYDSDTAKCLGTASNNRGRGDFSHFEESLYVKKTGEFFLYGAGGPLTKYRTPVQNGAYGGSAIFPLSIEKARLWAAEWLEVEEYEDIFGEVEE